MTQIFHRSTNTLARVSIFGAVFFVAVLLTLFAILDRSAYNTGQGIILQAAGTVQPLAPRLPARHRLSLLPRDRREGGLRGHAGDGDLHELPQADLGGQRDARAGSRQLRERRADRVGARP